MSRMIDADALVAALKGFSDTKNSRPHFMNGIRTALEIAENLPTIEPLCKGCAPLNLEEERRVREAFEPLDCVRAIEFLPGRKVNVFLKRSSSIEDMDSCIDMHQAMIDSGDMEYFHAEFPLELYESEDDE